MTRGRLEAFSDGVIAILITIMVLELKIPHGSDWTALRPLVPVFLSYVLSFAYLGIYWNNHHHMLHLCERITGSILWANLHLLFWLSLIPFTTGWLGENHGARAPAAAYGLNLLAAAFGWIVLQTAIVRAHGKDSKIAHALGNDLKGKASLAMYTAGVAMAFVEPWVSDALYVAVALMWLVPDRRFETRAAHPGPDRLH
jgi:uncharacterized membrane protein